MIPSAASIVRARFWFRVAVRGIALAWFVVSVREMPGHVVIVVQSQLQGGALSGGFVLQQVLQLIAAISLPLLLVLFENRLARWIIPTPKHACPSCGYPLANLKSPVCPECGDNVRGVAE